MSTPTRLEVLANAVLNCLLTHQYQAAERYMRLAELTILDEGTE